MVKKVKHDIKGHGYCCDFCGFMYLKITHARECEIFCKKFGRFSLDNIRKAIGRVDVNTGLPVDV